MENKAFYIRNQQKTYTAGRFFMEIIMLCIFGAS